jgi:hypothetical protein
MIIGNNRDGEVTTKPTRIVITVYDGETGEPLGESECVSLAGVLGFGSESREMSIAVLGAFSEVSGGMTYAGIDKLKAMLMEKYPVSCLAVEMMKMKGSDLYSED